MNRQIFPDKRIFFNLDDTHFFYTRADDEVLNEESIRSFIRQYAGSGIGDFALCCTGRISDYPSKTRMWWGDKYDQREENGIAVDYRTHPVVRCATRLFRDLALDFYAVCIDELRKIGIRPWLSFRMNDCHDNNLPASFLHPDFYHKHPKLRRVMHRAPGDYFDRCYDYAQTEVRQAMLDFIAETLDRYDTDGLELDWQREIFCFKIGHEWEGLAILTEFMRQVRALADRAEEKWGHPIRIGVRTLPAPQSSMDSGFDVITWAREGLIDVLVPCPRWATADCDIPAELWKQLLHGTDVTLAVGIELLHRSTPRSALLYNTAENVNGLAAQYLSMGADMIYLYNYFDRLNVANYDEAAHIAVHPDFYSPLLRTIGSMDALLRAERRHVVSYRDITPMWESIRKGAPLPFTAHRGGSFLRVRVGEIPEGAKVEVRIGADAEQNDPFILWANSTPCTYLRTETVIPAYTAHPAQVYKIENDGHLPPFIVLEIRTRGDEMTVDYVEIHVIP